MPALLLLLPLAAACKQGGGAPPAQPSPAALGSEEEKTAYAAGILLGRNLVPLKLSPAELQAAQRGLADAAAGKPPQVDVQTYGAKVQGLLQTRIAGKAQGEKDKGKGYAETAAQEQGATRTASGLVFKTLAAGKGNSPKATDTVRVHYRGTLLDGTEFDSSIKRGEPAEFPLSGVIPCWTEGVQKMKLGEKARLVCPSEIAYGDQGSPPNIPGGATLVFEVELLEILKK